jgi:hypothetical protein
MKIKATTLIAFVLLFAFNSAKSQTATINPHPWELGLNIGASWYKSDIRMKKLGVGAGFTFGQTYCRNKTSPLFWGWRFRYLNANAYGQDFQKSYGIKNNFVLNGTTDTTLNYFNHGGYVYQNYKSTLDELSFEIKIGANRLRDRTGILAYVFGGAGITKTVTRIDQLDGLGKRYNYNLIDSAGTASKSDVLTNLNNLYDGNYETLAEGSKNPRWLFMPSFGVGLGYQVGPVFSFGLEHKMTWALNDLIDGQQWTGTNEKTGTNDKYHYTSFWIKFSFGGKGKYTSSSSSNTNSNVNSYSNTTPTEKPIITITNPTSNPYNTSQQSLSFTAKVTDVNSKADISLLVNGAAVTNFTYNASTDVLVYNSTLNTGNNSFVITATNTIGSSTETQTVVYTEPAPVITITSPTVNPLNTNTNMATVTATINNISNASQIVTTVNGVNTTSFTFNASNHQYTMPANLVIGSNTVVITATNAAGADTKSVTVIYTQPVVNTTPAPIVTITNPTINPYTVNSATCLVTANIQNVATKGQVNVTLNGGPVASGAISFDAASGNMSFTANLMLGTNSVVVGATNVSGADSKSLSIVYSQPAPVALPPVITITNPTVNPATINTNVATVNASIANISAASQISVNVNGTPTAAFTYSNITNQFILTTNLILGSNSVVITANNAAGVDTKAVTIIYQQPVNNVPPPIVTITNPLVNPFNTNTSSHVVKATIQNITSKSQINASVNGSSIAISGITFNPSSGQVSFTANLIAGANTIVIGATNVSGADTKSTTIIYSAPVPTVVAPVVTITNPASNPFNTTSNTATVNATITNVNASQIAVSVNGTPTTAFTYNASSSQLNLTANLILGANTVTITGTNSAGSDTKSTTIIYSIPAPTVIAPVVTITNPASNPFNTTSNTATVNATVTNVNASQIAVSVNGTPATAFTYNASSSQLNLTANLILGANTVTITGTNSAGSDTKSTTIIYSVPAPIVVAPVVTITNPASNPFNTTSNTATVNATVTNVNASQIAVSVNGTPTTAFTYNAASSQLNLTANLILGANTVTITGTNSAGSDTKSTTIIYSMPAPTVLPPVVTITSPATNPFTTIANTSTVNATVTNVTSAQIAVSVNGTPTTAFTYNAASSQLNMTVNLVSGNNTVVVSAANSAGTDSKSTIINYKLPEVVVLPPTVTFLTPASSPITVNNETFAIVAKTTNVSSASQVSVKINGVATTAFTFVALTKKITLTASLNLGTNTVSITVTNSAGTDTKTTTIIYEKIVIGITPDTLNTPANPTNPSDTGGTPISTTPNIMMLNPVANPFTTTDASIVISARIMYINDASNIVVKHNGSVLSGVNYVAKTKSMSVSVNLVSGTNTIVIEASNASGTKTETITVNK